MNGAAGLVPAGRHLALAAGLLALAGPAGAQPGALPTVAVLSFHSPDVTAPVVSALRRGLEERGWVDGRTIRVVSRSADGRRDRLAALAEELARQRVDVVVTGGDLALAAIQRATRTIPVVFGLGGGDPVALGFVATLARPGARLVGVAAASIQLHRERLEILRAVVPRLARVAVVANAAHRLDARTTAELGVAADALGLALDYRTLRDVEERARVLVGRQAAGTVDGLLFMSDQTFFEQRADLGRGRPESAARPLPRARVHRGGWPDHRGVGSRRTNPALSPARGRDPQGNAARPSPGGAASPAGGDSQSLGGAPPRPCLAAVVLGTGAGNPVSAS